MTRSLGRFARVLAVLSAACWGAAMAVPVLSVTSLSPGPAIGETFEVDVGVADIADLYAFNFSLAFDPAVLQLQAIDEGPFLGGAGATVFIPGDIDNVAGTAIFTGGSLLSLVPGPSGSGVLAKFSFRAAAGGSSALALSDVLMLDSSLVEVAVTAIDGHVTTVPEPMSLALWLAGLVALGRKRLARGRLSPGSWSPAAR